MPELIADLPAVAILLPAASVYVLWALFHWLFTTPEDGQDSGETSRTNQDFGASDNAESALTANQWMTRQASLDTPSGATPGNLTMTGALPTGQTRALPNVPAGKLPNSDDAGLERSDLLPTSKLTGGSTFRLTDLPQAATDAEQNPGTNSGGKAAITGQEQSNSSDAEGTPKGSMDNTVTPSGRKTKLPVSPTDRLGKPLAGQQIFTNSTPGANSLNRLAQNNGTKNGIDSNGSVSDPVEDSSQQRKDNTSPRQPSGTEHNSRIGHPGGMQASGTQASGRQSSAAGSVETTSQTQPKTTNTAGTTAAVSAKAGIDKTATPSGDKTNLSASSASGLSKPLPDQQVLTSSAPGVNKPNPLTTNTGTKNAARVAARGSVPPSTKVESSSQAHKDTTSSRQPAGSDNNSNSAENSDATQSTTAPRNAGIEARHSGNPANVGNSGQSVLPGAGQSATPGQSTSAGQSDNKTNEVRQNSDQLAAKKNTSDSTSATAFSGQASAATANSASSSQATASSEAGRSCSSNDPKAGQHAFPESTQTNHDGVAAKRDTAANNNANSHHQTAPNTQLKNSETEASANPLASPATKTPLAGTDHSGNSDGTTASNKDTAQSLEPLSPLLNPKQTAEQHSSADSNASSVNNRAAKDQRAEQFRGNAHAPTDHEYKNGGGPLTSKPTTIHNGSAGKDESVLHSGAQQDCTDSLSTKPGQSNTTQTSLDKADKAQIKQGQAQNNQSSSGNTGSDKQNQRYFNLAQNTDAKHPDEKATTTAPYKTAAKLKAPAPTAEVQLQLKTHTIGREQPASDKAATANQNATNQNATNQNVLNEKLLQVKDEQIKTLQKKLQALEEQARTTSEKDPAAKVLPFNSDDAAGTSPVGKNTHNVNTTGNTASANSTREQQHQLKDNGDGYKDKYEELSAKLVGKERKLLQLQSTVNNLQAAGFDQQQQTRPVSQTNNRPTLLSKVRVMTNA